MAKKPTAPADPQSTAEPTTDLPPAETPAPADPPPDLAEAPPPEPEIVPAAPAEPPPPWRVVAVCKKPVGVYFGGGFARLLGGEWVTEPDRLAVVAGDTEHFAFLPCQDAEHLARMQAQYAHDLAQLTEMAAEMGYTVHPAGAVCPKPKR